MASVAINVVRKLVVKILNSCLTTVGVGRRWHFLIIRDRSLLEVTGPARTYFLFRRLPGGERQGDITLRR